MAALLGKLFISPGSSEDKLRDMYTEISLAVEDNLLTDATSKNSLLKIHVSLGKIVNSLEESQQQQAVGSRSTRSISTTVPPTGESAAGSAESTMVKVEEEDEDSVGGELEDDDTVTVMPRMDNSGAKRESLTDDSEALDGDDTVMRD